MSPDPVRPRWRSKLAIACLAVLMGLGIGELLVRGLGRAPVLGEIALGAATSSYERSSNPRLGFELKANVRDPEADCRGRYARTNAHGQRDVERELAKPVGSERVALLGDSVVEGFGVCALDDTISRQMEALHPSGTREVLNFGVSGYCTRAEVELLEVKGLAFDPDVVVVVFTENDFDNFNREAHELEADFGRPAWAEALFAGSHLFRSLCVALDWFRYGADVDPAAWNQAAIGDNNVATGLERLRELAEREGFAPLVVVWPQFRDDSIVDPHPLEAGTGGELVIERLARARGIPVARLSPYFERDRQERAGAVNPRLLYTQKDRMHPSVEGCRVAARAIDAVLEELPELQRAAADVAARGSERAADEAALELARSKGEAKANRSRVYNNQGLALYAQGDLDGAIERFRAALDEDPGFAKAHYNLANALFGKGEGEAASRHYGEALRLRPDDPKSHYNYGVALMLSGRPTDALPRFREAVRLDPELVDAYFHLGNLAVERGELELALEHYQRVLALRPDASGVSEAVATIRARLESE